MPTASSIKERPILFSGPMVLALLSGVKTQTRRVIKGVESVEKFRLQDGFLQVFIGDVMDLPETDPDAWHMVHTDWERGYHCPYGQPGDRLWVRETFCIGYPSGDPGHWSIIRPTGSDPQKDGRAFYAASFTEEPDEPRMCWKPSIHMPRWASRLTLEITDVRVERLNDISEEDAQAEGVEPVGLHPPSHVLAFRQVWDRINGQGSTYANPWVWTLTFKRISE